MKAKLDTGCSVAVLIVAVVGARNQNDLPTYFDEAAKASAQPGAKCSPVF